MTSDRSRLRGEDGNTLLLMPVGVLILLVLGAIAVDFAIVYTAQRELANLTAGLANDAAGAVDEDAFYRDGVYRIDGSRARGVVSYVVATRPDDTLVIDCPTVALDAPDVVRVACVGTIDLVFSGALPGGVSPYTVRASSTARADEGP
ncbi:MAG: hypothetical protein WEB09_03100 [Nitriliruptor sp.]